MAERRREPRVDAGGPGVVIGCVQLAAMFDRSRDWARARLEQWERAQQNGGPVLVFRVGRLLFTTTGALHVSMPPARDVKLVKAVATIDADVTELARTVEFLKGRLASLEGRRGRTTPVLVERYDAHDED